MDTPDSSPKSGLRMLSLVLGGLIGGHLVAVFIAYCLPKTYESRATVIDGSPAGTHASLSPAHAAIITHKLSLNLQWQISISEAMERLQNMVVIESSIAGTEISTRSPSDSDARRITEAVTDSFQGISHEANWGSDDCADRPFTKQDSQTFTDIWKLREMIAADLIERRAAKPGQTITDAELKALGDVDLTRRFDAYQKLVNATDRFAPPAESFILPPMVLVRPPHPEDALFPDIDGIILAGQVIGTLVGLGLLLLILKRRPDLLVVAPRKSAPSPRLARNGAPTAPSGEMDW
jgi:hypothetical protein